MRPGWNGLTSSQHFSPDDTRGAEMVAYVLGLCRATRTHQSFLLVFVLRS